MTRLPHTSGSSLAALQHEVGHLAAQLERAMELGRTVSAGRDPTGAVTVVLGDDSAASDIRIAHDWHRRLLLEHVGEAVVAADSDAAQRRAHATGEALARVKGETPDLSTPPPVDQAGPMPWSGAAYPRPLADLADLARTAYDDIVRLTTPPPVTGTGADAAIRLSLTNGRITGCDIDARWLKRQDDTTLAYALREALASAAAAQIEADRPAAEFSQRLSELVADVKSTLRDIERTRPDPR